MTDLVAFARERAGRPALSAAPALADLQAGMTGCTLVIVGNGPSDTRDLTDLKNDPATRIWCINSGWIRHPEADLVWVMDDLDGPAWESVPGLDRDGARREFPREETHAIFGACHLPIMHSRAHPKFPQTIEFPLQLVMDRFGRPHFAETVCYAMAWAIALPVASIHLIGCDYLRGSRPAEAQALVYWIGRAEEAGIRISIAGGSELMRLGPLDGVHRHIPGFYSYQLGTLPLRNASAYETGQVGDTYHVATGAAATMRGHLALDALLGCKDTHRVLDVGCGDGNQARYMADAGRNVVALDETVLQGVYDPSNHGRAMFLRMDYLDSEAVFAEPFDAIWCCHMLEHVRDPQAVLCKMFNDLREGGVLALTVPPAQHAVVGGHLTLWNAGLLLYHLVLAGFDCREASVKQYDYNISILLRKAPADLPTDLPANYPVERLRQWLPTALSWECGSFDGNIADLNWS
mgnify:CR=1 FL=1